MSFGEGFKQRREVYRGEEVTFEVNSKRMTTDRFVDRSRIATHDEWESNSNPMKPGRIVQKQNSIEDNARTAAGAMKVRSSFQNDDYPRRGDAGCLYDCGDGPMTKKRGDGND